MKIKKISSLYVLSNKQYEIFASVGENGITLTTYDDHDKFWFKNSQPEVIENVAKLMLKASKLNRKD